jgi:F-type H+-transporting ATPase subunit epsilon
MSVEEMVPEHPPGALRTGNIADELARGQVELNVVVVSPTRPIFEGEAHWVTAPGIDGLFAIWPRHAQIVVALGAGVLRIRLPGGAIARYAVKGGFLEAANNNVTVLVDSAMPESEAPEHVAEAEGDLAETVAELRHPESDEQFQQLLERRDWDQTRLKMARK